MQNLSKCVSAPPSCISDISPDVYVQLLHPEDQHGRPSLLWFEGDEPRNLCLAPSELELALPNLLDGRAYVSLNRFRYRRTSDQLVALNAVYVDLDWHKTARWRDCDVSVVEAAILHLLDDANLPSPSILLQSGRGSALIWLINDLPPAALKRWQAVMSALNEIFVSFGADRGCQDVARVFRLPSSFNEKSGKRVRVSAGMGNRHDFDVLADVIFFASGRPTRAELQTFRARKGLSQRVNLKGRAMPVGLPPAARFRQIRDDLEGIRTAHGGTIPDGMRNTWLHIFATTLTHDTEVDDGALEILEAARCATPDLPAQEVSAIIRTAERQAAGINASSPLADGRYHYSGSRIADLLGISEEYACSLNLRQVIPQKLRQERKAAASRAHRAQAGAKTRKEWLAANSASRDQPWKKHGISRTTYYARKKQGTLPGFDTA
ncbi:hypothetical protein AB4874_16070 [Thioclava sp. 15-R06ZXC-3]|uniref:RepB-like DNA primase domain-containing protein n=1 Tax=Thioclava arctica TaxID=3238301 RepID=A0ABV3TNI0_9RHOB